MATRSLKLQSITNETLWPLDIRVFHIRTEMPNVAYLSWFKIKVILFYELILLHSEIIVFKMKN